jgi:hypothetical protein
MRREMRNLNFNENPSDIFNCDRWTDVIGETVAFPAASRKILKVRLLNKGEKAVLNSCVSIKLLMGLVGRFGFRADRDLTSTLMSYSHIKTKRTQMTDSAINSRKKTNRKIKKQIR